MQIRIWLMMLAVLLSGTAKPADARSRLCGGANMLGALKTDKPAQYAALLRAEKKVRFGKARFWKIEKEGQPNSWLYGTMHLADPRLLTFLQPMRQALTSSSIVALENIDVLDKKRLKRQMAKLGHFLVLPKGKSLRGLMSPSQFMQLEQALRNFKLSPKAVMIYKPWLVMTMLSIPLCDIGQTQKHDIVDLAIAKLGKRSGAKLVGLETLAEQFSAMDSLSLRAQLRLLHLAVASHKTLPDQMETMKQLYLESRLGAFWALSDVMIRRHGDGGDKNLLKAFKTALIARRNKVMLQRAVPLLKKGGAFIAVGALHLPGKEGLVHLLSQKGYRLTPVF